MVMASFENGAAEGVVSRNIDAAFVGEDACFDLPVGKLGMEGERNVLMHGLESLKDEGVTCGCGFNMMGEGNVDEVHEEGRWEKSNIGVVGVFCRKKVGLAGEGVRTSKKLSGYMDHFQVEVRKVDEPASLSVVESLGLVEVGEVFVIGEDLHREGGAVKVVVPGFQGTNDCKEFMVIDIIVSFCG